MFGPLKIGVGLTRQRLVTVPGDVQEETIRGGRVAKEVGSGGGGGKKDPKKERGTLCLVPYTLSWEAPQEIKIRPRQL